MERDVQSSRVLARLRACTTSEEDRLEKSQTKINEYGKKGMDAFMTECLYEMRVSRSARHRTRR